MYYLPPKHRKTQENKFVLARHCIEVCKYPSKTTERFVVIGRPAGDVESVTYHPLPPMNTL